MPYFLRRAEAGKARADVSDVRAEFGGGAVEHRGVGAVLRLAQQSEVLAAQRLLRVAGFGGALERVRAREHGIALAWRHLFKHFEAAVT